MNPIVYALLGIIALCSVTTLIVVLINKPKDYAKNFQELQASNDDTKNAMGGLQRSVETSSAVTKEMIASQTNSAVNAVQGVTSSIAEQFSGFREENANQIKMMQSLIGDQVAAIRADSANVVNTALQTSQTVHQEMMQNSKNISDVLQAEMKQTRDIMQANLDNIRNTVNEQLQTNLEKTLQESFRTVTEQLMAVQQGLGQMTALASDVGDLRKTLSNVKTRGIWGEIQLGAILAEILTPEQYAVNIATVPRSTERVEFAIKLPGQGTEHVWLPIDSKFPGDTYNKLLDAYDSGNPSAVDSAWKVLETTLSNEAKDIHTKYVHTPETTDFAIMFLPVEGLYAEAVKHGMVEKLQKKYKINIAGPTTMAALLNSLQMGFKTLQIQKQSSEVWNVLQNTKYEFEKYAAVLSKVQERLRQTEDELETLVGVRTRVLAGKLAKVEKYNQGEIQPKLE
jgi:DNA recombination protein RmuC